MPQFTPWAVQSPFPNVLYNPAAVDKSIAESQSLLGELDVNRQRLGLDQRKLDLQQAGGQALIDSLKGGGGGTAAPADATPFEQQMGFSEGGNSADKVNAGGYAGQFQFGAGRLADLGLYTPAPGEDLKSNQWKGQFHIAPYNVASLDDFLKNPAAQHAAFVAHVADIDKTIDSTPGADKFDRNGLRAVAHLGGTGSLRAFIASGGNLDRADSNGTTLKGYYQKFAQGGAPLLQQTFGSVHGPGGPPSDIPAVQPGGRVGTAWIDPNAPLPTPPIPPSGGAPPPFNPNAGPRVAATPDAAPGTITPPAEVGVNPNAAVPIPPPVQTSQADGTGTIPPSPIALRTGGTDVAGPGAGQTTAPATTLPPVEAPNRMYQTGLAGITIGGPGNPLAPPGAAPGVPPGTPPGAAPTPAAAPTAQRPPLPPPPPAPSRVIPLEPVLPNGLTASQVRIAASMVQSGTPVGDVAAHIEQWKQANIQGRQQAATQAALEAQQNYDRQEAYRKAQVAAEQTQYERGRQSQADQRAADEAARQAAEEERKRAAAADPLQGKNDDERMERTLLTIGPKVRAGMPLTPAEEDQYDLMRTRYAEGPVQQVPDGKGGTVLAHVPREIPARFPPLPGKTDAAGPKPIPGTEKQPDFAPQPIIGGLLANATGQTKIAKALASLQAYPGAVGPIALQPDFLSQRTDPEGVRLRADIGDVQGHIFHDLAGSAQSAQESARLRPFVPTPTDSAEAIKTKLTRMLEVNRETMLQGYRAYGPEVGGRRIPVIEEAILGSIPEAALNDLKADPKLAGAFDRKYGKGTAKLVLQ